MYNCLLKRSTFWGVNGRMVKWTFHGSTWSLRIIGLQSSGTLCLLHLSGTRKRMINVKPVLYQRADNSRHCVAGAFPWRLAAASFGVLRTDVKAVSECYRKIVFSFPHNACTSRVLRGVVVRSRRTRRGIPGSFVPGTVAKFHGTRKKLRGARSWDSHFSLMDVENSFFIKNEIPEREFPRPHRREEYVEGIEHSWSAAVGGVWEASRFCNTPL